MHQVKNQDQIINKMIILAVDGIEYSHLQIVVAYRISHN